VALDSWAKGYAPYPASPERLASLTVTSWTDSFKTSATPFAAW
jgi:hypothetical protein